MPKSIESYPHGMNRRDFLKGTTAASILTFFGCRNSDTAPENRDPATESVDTIPLAEIHIHTDCAHTAESIARHADRFNIEAFRKKTVKEIQSMIAPPKGEALKPAMSADEAQQKWDNWYSRVSKT